jgi:hypothetical protein
MKARITMQLYDRKTRAWTTRFVVTMPVKNADEGRREAKGMIDRDSIFPARVGAVECR